MLPSYDFPEIQVRGDTREVFRIEGDNTTIRNLAIYLNDKSGILVDSGTAFIYENLLGVNALGVKSGNLEYAVEMKDGEATITRNYFSGSDKAGILIDGGTSTTIINNQQQ